MVQETDSQSLRDRVSFLKTILHNLTDGVIVADLEGRFLFFNQEAEKILGLGLKDVNPTEWTEVYGCRLPDEVTPYPTDQLPLSRALRGEEVLNEVIYIKNAEQPSGVWINVSSRPLKNEEGEVFGGVVIFQDITEQRTLQQRIKTAERLCEAVEQTADSVVITDRQARIEYVNPAFEETTGYCRNEVTGKPASILKSGLHQPEFYENIWGEILAGRPFKGTIINKTKAGELYWAQQTITPMKDDQGEITHFVSVLKDITELLKKKELEVEMRLAREVQQKFYATTALVPGYDIAGAAYPADETGGDYFDFFPMSNDCLGIAIGDVSSHGIGAALVMAETRAYLRSFATITSDVSEIMTRVNRALAQDLDSGRFVTLLLIRLDPSKRLLTYANAGHIPGFLLDGPGKEAIALESTGPPLGPLSDFEYASGQALSMNPGKTVLLMTDGIVESMALEDIELGISQAVEYVSSHRHESAREIVEGLCRTALTVNANQPQQDDATTVIIKAS